MVRITTVQNQDTVGTFLDQAVRSYTGLNTGSLKDFGVISLVNTFNP